MIAQEQKNQNCHLGALVPPLHPSTSVIGIEYLFQGSRWMADPVFVSDHGNTITNRFS